MTGTYAQTGVANPGDGAVGLNSQVFLVQRLLNQRHTATMASVVGTTNIVEYGSAEAIKTIDVMPLVNELTGNAQPVPHGVVYGVKYFRLQGGGNAVICDPVAGDVGIFLIAETDTSNVIATGKQANPGSARRNNYSDGMYIGSVVAGAPNQYVAFTATGITITDKNGNVIVTGSSGVTVNGALITLGGDVITKRGTDVDTHVHTMTQPGSGDSGPPA